MIVGCSFEFYYILESFGVRFYFCVVTIILLGNFMTRVSSRMGYRHAYAKRFYKSYRNNCISLFGRNGMYNNVLLNKKRYETGVSLINIFDAEICVFLITQYFMEEFGNK
jgi:hypothetical protein